MGDVASLAWNRKERIRTGKDRYITRSCQNLAWTGYIGKGERNARHVHPGTDTVQNNTDAELSADASETCEEAGKGKDQLRLYIVSVRKR